MNWVKQIFGVANRFLTSVCVLTVLCGCGSIQKTIPPELEHLRPQLEKAQTLSDDGDHKGASEILKKLASDSHSVFLWSSLGSESLLSGQTAQAESAFLEAALWATPERAVHGLENILPKGVVPDVHWAPADYWFARARFRIHGDELKNGLSDLNIVIRLAPDRIERIVKLCQSLKEEGSKMKAGEVCLFAFQYLNSKEAKHAQTKAMRKEMFTSTMIIAQETGNERFAAQAMFHLVKDWPVDAALKFLSNAMKDSHSKALPIVLDLMAKEHPNSPELLMERARTLSRGGEYEELLILAESLDPRARYVHQIYAMAIEGAFKIDEPKRAIVLAGRRRGAQPYIRENLHALIRTLFRAGQYARARSESMLGLKQFQRDLELMRFLALAQSHTGDSVLALEVMESVLRRTPRDPFAANFVAYGLAEENRSLKRAARLVEIALKASPQSMSYLDTKAWILYRQGEFEEAHRILRPIVEKNSDNSELLFHLACIQQRLNKDGTKYYQRAIELEKNAAQRGRYEREWKSISEQ